DVLEDVENGEVVVEGGGLEDELEVVDAGGEEVELEDDGKDVLELEVDEEVLEDEDDVEVLDTGVLELALELLGDKKDDDVVDGVEVADAVIIEAPVGLEVDEDEVLELLVLLGVVDEVAKVELELEEVELEDVVLCTLYA
ncbi:hypothetical protein KCU89_g13697, partial [Aureobasidium melanogenum]